VKRYSKGTLIDFPSARWFHYFSVQDWKDGEYYDAFMLRLPSWGYGYDICMDEERWGQRVLKWRGKRGFSMGWSFLPQDVRSITPDVSGCDL
jgi:hypothetical protein